jgi:hypothetical protein
MAEDTRQQTKPSAFAVLHSTAARLLAVGVLLYRREIIMDVFTRLKPTIVS